MTGAQGRAATQVWFALSITGRIEVVRSRETLGEVKSIGTNREWSCSVVWLVDGFPERSGKGP